LTKQKQDDIWVICPECKTKLKKENLSAHMKHVHDKKIEDYDESSIKVLPKKGQKQKKTMNLGLGTIAVILVISVFIVGAVFFVFSGSSDDSNNNSNENSNNTSNTVNWFENYTPVHSIGTGSDKFWINFPSGQSVQHKTWITQDLEEKPVFFVCHRTGCYGCTAQADRVKALGETYAEDAVFYDLDDPYPGYGDSTADILEKYNAAFDYDPNGGSHYIALTGVFTLVNDGGEVKIGWHSWEGDVSDSEMESWVKDIIYYYHVNK